MSEKVAIYFDTEGIALARTQGKTLIASTFLSFSTIEEVSLEDFSQKTRDEALLKKGLRELKSETATALIGVSDKYTLFRHLEMPLMKKNELSLALPLEIEKYIPFKIEDIAWDYNKKTLSLQKDCESGSARAVNPFR